MQISPQIDEEIGNSIFVKQKLPDARPLLPRTLLKSQLPRSIIQFTPKQVKKVKQTQSQLLSRPSLRDEQQFMPYKRLSDFLKDKSKITYNIIGNQFYNIDESTFGFQYFNKLTKQYTSKKLINTGTNTRVLQFESRFQSGNLLFACELTSNHYILMIRPDYNTMSFCQWFYFRVKNNSNLNIKIKFSIINMTKSASLFNKGMKILSLNQDQDKWIRTGQNITYKSNHFKRKNGSNYYTLSWQTNLNTNNEIYYAYSQPYTFSELNDFLDELEYSKYVRRSILCRSLLQNRIDMITISSGSLQNKKIIIIISRCHPTETVSSFVMNGVINFLVSEAPQAQNLRQKFVFKLIPMVNPDGVIHGNSRCSMKGQDLNRKWTKPIKFEDPQVYYLKNLIVDASKSDRLLMFCDLHGHSKKKNIFIYGCHDYSQPYASRQFPFILSKLFEPFSYKDCNFAIDKFKKGTARVSLWKKLKIPNIFTLQSSFCSSQNAMKHLDQKGYLLMGENLCRAMNIYFINNYEFNKSKSNKTNISSGKLNIFNNEREIGHLKLKNQVCEQLKHNMLQQLYQNKNLLECGLQSPSNSESQSEQQHIYNSIQRNLDQSPTTRIKSIKVSTTLNKKSQTEKPRLKINIDDFVQIKKRTQKQSTNRIRTFITQQEEFGQSFYKPNQLSFKKFDELRQRQKKQSLLPRRKIEKSLNVLRFPTENQITRIPDQFQFKFSPLNINSCKYKSSIKKQQVKHKPKFINFNFEQKFRQTFTKIEKQKIEEINNLNLMNKINSNKQSLLRFVSFKIKQDETPYQKNNYSIFNSDRSNRKNVEENWDATLKRLNRK